MPSVCFFSRIAQFQTDKSWLLFGVSLSVCEREIELKFLSNTVPNALITKSLAGSKNKIAYMHKN